MAKKSKDPTPPQRIRTDPLWGLLPADADERAPERAPADEPPLLPATQPMSVAELRALGLSDLPLGESSPGDSDAHSAAQESSARDTLPSVSAETPARSLHDARTDLLPVPPPTHTPAQLSARAAPSALAPPGRRAIPDGRESPAGGVHELPGGRAPAARTAPAAAEAMITDALLSRGNGGRRLLWMVVACCALSGGGVGLLLGPRWSVLATPQPPAPLAVGGTLRTEGWSARLLGAAVSDGGRLLQLRFAVLHEDRAPDPAELRVQIIEQGRPIEALFWSDETPAGTAEHSIRFVFRLPRPPSPRLALRFAPRGAAAVDAVVMLSPPRSPM